MKRTFKILAVCLIALVLFSAIAVSLVIWALNTAEGTRVLLKVVSIVSPLGIDAGEITGRIRDDLRIRDLRLRLGQMEMRADRFRLRWEAGRLLDRKVLVHDLSLEGVQIRDNRPGSKEVSIPGWPAAPFWLSRLQGRVESLAVKNLEYRRLEQPSAHADNLSARVLWDGDVLTVDRFTAAAPSGTAEGEMKMGFSRPALDLDLRAAAGKEVAGFESVLVRLGLKPAQGREDASGHLLVSAAQKGAERLHLESDVNVTRTSLGFRNVRLSQPGRKATLRGEADVLLGTPLKIRLNADFADVDLAPELGTPTDLSGNLELKGPLDDYRGRLSISNAVEGWQKVRVEGSLRGNLESVKVANLDASLLGGSAKGQIELSWAGGLSVRGNIRGRKLNPASFAPEVQGDVNLNLQGRYDLPEKGSPKAEVAAALLESRLVGQNISGDLSARVEDGLFRISRLNLRGRGFTVQARGTIQERVDLSAAVADLSGLVPGGRGSLSAAGWVSYRDNRVTGRLEGSGKDMFYQSLRAATVNLLFSLKELKPGSDPVLSAELRAGNLQAGPLPADSVMVKAEGTLPRHRADISVTVQNGGLEGALAGGYEKGIWKGRLEKLAAKDPQGPWSLQKPAGIVLSSRRIVVDPLVVKSTKGETVQAQADLALEPVSGSAEARWGSVDLSRANPWLPGGTLSGRTSGSASARWLKSGTEIAAALNVKGAAEYGRVKVGASSAEGKLSWNQKGLEASAGLSLTQGGRMEARISSPEPFKAALPASGKGNGRWQNVETGILAALFPPEYSMAGRTSGEVSGTWSGSRFDAAGAVKILQARVSWSGGPKPVVLNLNAADMRFNWGEKGLDASVALDLKEGGKLSGNIFSPDPARFAVPRQGRADTTWTDLNIAVLGPFLPKGFSLGGASSGRLAGSWSPGPVFDAAGEVQISRGNAGWQGGPKPVSVKLDTARADFAWQGQTLKGTLDLSSPDHGWLKGTFLLPIPATSPPFFRPLDPLSLSLQAQLQDRGLLATLYSDHIRNSRAQLKLDLTAGGTFEKPQIKGSARLSEAAFQFSKPAGPKQDTKARPPVALEIPSASATLDWGGQGLAAKLEIVSAKNGRIDGALSSPEPARFAVPEQGSFELAWTALDLGVLQPWIPERISLDGQAAGRVKGRLFPGRRLEANGEFGVEKGNLSWRGNGGLVSAALNHSALKFFWRGEGVEGNVNLTLNNYGFLKGDFSLPLPARLPPRFDPAGPLRISLKGQAEEKGLLSAVFPGMVEETRGKLDFSFTVGGTWGKPLAGGTVQLAEAQAKLPTLGIRVEDISTRWALKEDRVEVESFQARSGPGRIEATATAWLEGRSIRRYEGRLRGDRFQTFYLPDIRIQSSPNLTFQGSLEQLTVRGEIVLPEVLIHGVSGPGVVRSSRDVVIIDQPERKELPLSIDIQVRVTLGQNVQAKAAGIDTRLAGSVDLKIVGLKPEEMTARGQVRTVGGNYTGYGLSLRIDQGLFVYSGGPVENPGLNIVALRKPDDVERMYSVKVGLAVVGTLKNPVVKLYSQPAMRDEEILSYLLLGKPYDPKQGNLSLLLAGAEGLLSGSGPGVVDKLKAQLGIDTVDIQTGSGDFSRSMVTVGKYLNPQIYVSYGYSMFSTEQLLKIRYQLSKRWEVETYRGIAMGVDLFYRIEFY